MMFLDVLSRIVHVGTVIALVGGSLFTLAVLIPSARELDSEPHDRLSSSVLGRWKRFVHIGVTLILLSGLYNYVRAMDQHDGDGLYHGLVGTKILLALVVFFIAAALVGRSAKLESMRQNRSRWLKVLVALAAIIVCISGYLKVRGPQTPRALAAPQAAVESDPAR